MSSGIYQILNKVNGKMYIGQSTNILSRKRHHFCSLRVNSHPNKYLQSAFNIVGEQNFEFNVLEHVEDTSSLTSREQYWLDLMKAADSNYGYNLAICADSPMRGRTHTLETRTKLSNAHIGIKNPSYGKAGHNLGKQFSNETKRKMSAAHTGLHHASTTRAKIGMANATRRVTKISRDKIRAARLGTHHSEATCAKISVANIGRHRLTEEHKYKLLLGRLAAKTARLKNSIFNAY